MNIGVDVSKNNLDVCFGDSHTVKRFANTSKGHRNIIKALASRNISKVVMESTGGYERIFAQTLVKSGIRTYRVNPRQVRDFAKAKGFIEKTDIIDAQIIADYAEVIVKDSWPTVPLENSQIAELRTRRGQLLMIHQQEKNRLECTSKAMAKIIHVHLDFLKLQIKDVVSQLQAVINKNPELHAKQKLLESQVGIGKVASWTILACLPEIGTLNKKEIAKLAGLAPLCRDSGNFRGYRSVRHGRADIRKVMFMAALSASRFNPELKLKADQMKAMGKPPKVVLIAIARKLLVRANAIIRDGEVKVFNNKIN